MPDACNKRGKWAHDRNESREDDRLAAVARIELVRSLEGPLVQESGMRFFGRLAPEQAADPVIAVVAAKRCDDQRQREQLDRHAGGGPERAGSEQQRVARQERGDDEARLAEDGQEQDQIEPSAIVEQQQGELVVEIADELPNRYQEVHARRSFQRGPPPCNRGG